MIENKPDVIKSPFALSSIFRTFPFMIVILFATQLNAQDIEGIQMLDSLSRYDVIKLLGEPKEYHTDTSDYTCGLIQTFIYDSCNVVIDDYYLDSFIVSKRGINTLRTFIPGGLQVGDKYTDKEKAYVEKYMHLYEEYDYKGEHVYRYYLEEFDRIQTYIHVKNGIVTKVISDWYF